MNSKDWGKPGINCTEKLPEDAFIAGFTTVEKIIEVKKETMLKSLNTPDVKWFELEDK